MPVSPRPQCCSTVARRCSHMPVSPHCSQGCLFQHSPACHLPHSGHKRAGPPGAARTRVEIGLTLFVASPPFLLAWLVSVPSAGRCPIAVGPSLLAIPEGRRPPLLLLPVTSVQVLHFLSQLAKFVLLFPLPVTVLDHLSKSLNFLPQLQ